MAIFVAYLLVSVATFGSFLWYIRDEKRRSSLMLDDINCVPQERASGIVGLIAEMFCMSFCPIAHWFALATIWVEIILERRKK